MKRILLAEDDQDLGTMLKQFIKMNKFEVQWCSDGEEAWEAFNSGTFDLCVLDVMMPKLDGFKLAQRIVEFKPETPFLFLTARISKEDRIKGLKLGADDYVVKPFEAEELIYRIKNIIKRTEQHSIQLTSHLSEKTVSIGQYSFDMGNLELRYRDHEAIKLTPREGKLLHFLLENKNRLIRREEILSAVWGKTDFFTGRSMDVFISRIRKYIQQDPAISLESLRGIGLEFKIN